MILSKMVYEKDEFNLRPLGLILEDEEPGDDDTVMSFWLHNRVFTCERHKEVMEQCAPVPQTWRMKERMKTVSVALVLCLNIGVDPPDLVKISPCARLQCWIDPQQFGDPSNDTSAQKAIDIIGAALQKQYERWQPKARYKLSLDPTVDDVKKLSTSLRRNAKEERVLFHYNGHGVPRPTPNGEIWVFNKHYTQYIPLSMCDLRMWMGSPSIYVFDCSNAGNVVEHLRNPPSAAIFKESDVDQYGDHDTSDEVSGKSESSCPASNPKGNPSSGSFILLAACQANETLPLNSGLPADLFTACLTTPIKIALKWYVLSRNSRLVPEFTADQADRIPGQLNDRRTMLGELNWIFTAITDTIAWNVLSKELFQKLFRQDLLVASLFRNFLLAERILHYYNCSPISVPQLPPTRHHFMWMAWDYALDGVLKQLPSVLANPASFKHSSFFSDQLTGFEMWLMHATSLKMTDSEWKSGNMAPPEQLPIVLQVLLSQVHRQRALELLGKFLNLGQWAASLALSVGIFPYVLKLLQSSAQELKSLLVFIWAKLLAIDGSCQADLVKDSGHKYFLDVLADLSMEAETRMTAAFVLAMIVDNFRPGQKVAVTNNIISLCLLQTTDPHPGLRQWVVLCLGKVWWKYDDARWRGVRDAAHEKLFPLLQDPIPEVRAATVYCLGSLMANTTKRDDQVIKIDNAVTTGLLSTLYDGSPIVRKELVVALAGYVVNFYAQFEKIASENFKKNSYHTVTGQDAMTIKGRKFKLPRSNSASDLTAEANSEACSLKHISNISPLQTLRSTNIPNNVWNSLVLLQNDPHPMVAQAASKLCEEVLKIATKKGRASQERHFGQIKQAEAMMDEADDPICHHPVYQSVTSNFFSWCCRKFSEPTAKDPGSDDVMRGGEEAREDEKPGTAKWYDRDFKYNMAARVIKSAEREQQKSKSSKLDEQIMQARLSDRVSALRFHPFDPHLAIVEGNFINIWDWEQGYSITTFDNRNTAHTRVNYLNFLNPHDNSLLLTGTGEGLVRVWKDYLSPRNVEMVTSWTALNNLIPMSNSPGLVMDWDDENQLLYASGNVDYIRLWDVNTEMKIRDVPLKYNTYTTSLSLNTYNTNIIAGGFIDGTVRLFDKRHPKNESEIRCLREHSTRIQKVVCPEGFENLLITASNHGDVVFWDLRNGGITNKLPASQQSVELKAFDAHQRAEIMVCGYQGQPHLSALKYNGEVTPIKCHQGFMSQKNVNCTYLTFHPYKVKVAASNENNVVTVYGVKNSKKGDKFDE